MLAFVTKRILAVLPTMAVVSIVVFLLLRLSPGDPALVIAGENAEPRRRAHPRGVGPEPAAARRSSPSGPATCCPGRPRYLDLLQSAGGQLILQRVEPTLSLAADDHDLRHPCRHSARHRCRAQRPEAGSTAR